MDKYMMSQLFCSLVDLRKQLIEEDAPHNPGLLELTDKRIKECIEIMDIDILILDENEN